jgi:DNA-binding transcriptional regulator YhcF (GntR family)
MSIAWMSQVWNHGPDAYLDRYVLLKLADNADQDGRCFPSLPEICEKTRLSISTVRRSIASLESDGWITVIRGHGAGHRSQYQLQEKVSERKVSAGKVSDRKVSIGPKKGIQQAQKGIQQKNPPDPLIGVTVINHQEPPEQARAKQEPSACLASAVASFASEQTRKSGKADETVELPDWLNRELWEAYKEMRASKGKKDAATPLALDLLIKKLHKGYDDGLDVNSALEASTINGWKDVYFDKCPKRKRVFKVGKWTDPEHANWATEPDPNWSAR